ncbi:zinc finger CCHC-type and RNA-binding motif-containing protein 1-like isoform X1 [Cylas formicarius]|uniref:zinc finger CCHC-type and RNA-binding motif-containing protein 1-like isoform X1 n=1 Tax=Cylas formicarius TaxID=197179 RepID=UPI002958647D|nr:zinc finger CCHC-type and RNA-binding motif-containing protein 1-like isoform X1 [Cylas formicarius]
MSGRLAPSKSTVYLSNLPFALKNNDLHKLFEKYGKIVKVTVLKDRTTRKSKGVAFILFHKMEDARSCVRGANDTEMFGRVLKASIAKDNGRATEFIRRKDYPDKTRCYECGELGHLSYKCEENLLGERDPPPKKVRVRKKNREKRQLTEEEAQYFNSSDEELKEIGDEETLSAAIKMEQAKHELEEYRLKVATGSYGESAHAEIDTKRKIKKSSYFSDEEDSD